MFCGGASFHRRMDAAAGLKVAIGQPSSDTTVTENTEHTHTYIIIYFLHAGK